MAKQNVAEPETLGTAMNKTELFFEENGRLMSYIFLGLLILAALIFGYRSLIVLPRAEKGCRDDRRGSEPFRCRDSRF